MRAQKQQVESAPSAAQQAQGDAHVPGRLRELLGARIDREIYLSTEEAAQYVARPSRQAFIKWARRNGVPLRKPSPAARTLVVRKGDLDWALRARGVTHAAHDAAGTSRGGSQQS